MRRRALLLAATLGGCSLLPQRPYLEKREWPLQARRSAVLRPRPGAPVLLVRTLRAAPGLEARGLQTVQADGSLRTDPYEEWSVSPADGAEDQVRRWLADSGMFAGVLAPGSRGRADLALEGELLALRGDPARGVSHAAMAVVLLDLRPATVRLRLQTEAAGDAPLPVADGAGVARSGCAALAAMLAQLEDRLRAAL